MQLVQVTGRTQVGAVGGRRAFEGEKAGPALEMIEDAQPGGLASTEIKCDRLRPGELLPLALPFKCRSLYASLPTCPLRPRHAVSTHFQPAFRHPRVVAQAQSVRQDAGNA